jgi:protein SCO1/2
VDQPGAAEGFADAVNHRGHVMEMDASRDTLFTDGSLYQVESTWVTQDADTVHLGDLRGRFVFMALTYTSCEFSCPLIVADMKRIINQVPVDEKRRVHLVLLSIDPERDTPEVMKAFAASKELSSDQWTLIRGEADEVMEMAALLGIRYKKLPDGEFAHSNVITLLNPEGEIVHQQIGLGQERTAASSDKLLAVLSGEA